MPGERGQLEHWQQRRGKPLLRGGLRACLHLSKHLLEVLVALLNRLKGQPGRAVLHARLRLHGSSCRSAAGPAGWGVLPAYFSANSSQPTRPPARPPARPHARPPTHPPTLGSGGGLTEQTSVSSWHSQWLNCARSFLPYTPAANAASRAWGVVESSNCNRRSSVAEEGRDCLPSALQAAPHSPCRALLQCRCRAPPRCARRRAQQFCIRHHTCPAAHGGSDGRWMDGSGMGGGCTGTALSQPAAQHADGSPQCGDVCSKRASSPSHHRHFLDHQLPALLHQVKLGQPLPLGPPGCTQQGACMQQCSVSTCCIWKACNKGRLWRHAGIGRGQGQLACRDFLHLFNNLSLVHLRQAAAGVAGVDSSSTPCLAARADRGQHGPCNATPAACWQSWKTYRVCGCGRLLHVRDLLPRILGQQLTHLRRGCGGAVCRHPWVAHARFSSQQP